MLHILLILLKIIGIILVSVLALLLLLVLAVLFVPLRYRIQGKKFEQMEGDVMISWLFHVIHGRISYKSGMDGHPLKIVLRVFGIPLMDNTRVKKEKRPRRSRDKGGLKPKTAEQKPLEAEIAANEQRPVNDSGKIEDTIQDDIKTMEETKPVPVKKPEKKSKLSFKERIVKFFKKMKDSICRLKDRLTGLKDKLGRIQEKKESILKFINNEYNRIVFKKIWLCVKRVFREILPRRIEGVLHFGFEDPAATGKCLGCLAVLYPKIEDRLRVVPNFEKPVLEGSMRMSGHIRLGIIALCGLKLIIDKNVRRLIKDAKNL